MQGYLGGVCSSQNDRASASLDMASELPRSLDEASLEVDRASLEEGGVSADPLSDVLKTVRLTGAVFFDVVARAPWVAEQPAPQTIVQKILPGADHLISYHVITEGRCFANIVGQESIPVEEGEVIVFTRGDAHVMASSPGMRAEPSPASMYDEGAANQPFFANLGADGPIVARLVCGFFACDAAPFNPLLDNLPSIVKVRAGENAETHWLSQFIHVAKAESAGKRAGGESVLARLSELMFIEVVRRHLASLPPEQTGWLAGLRDPFIGKALSLIHASPSHNWTLEDLAREAGLSRSVLAERFTAFVGIPPMQYLGKWRMQIATGLLNSGQTNIASVAAEVGYGSEAAFSRAFKRIVGASPSEHRRRPVVPALSH
jgi:AraC-like DNA-binding protein